MSLIARITAAGACFGRGPMAIRVWQKQASAVVELPNGDLLLTGGQSPEGGNSNMLLLMGIGRDG